MKTIFLDIDGVLNHELFYRGYSIHKREMGKRNQGIRDFISEIDRGSVEILNELIKQTDAKVVISSTWRISRTVDELKDIFSHFNFVGEIIGCTPHFDYVDSVRGNEIRSWIRTNENLLGEKSYNYSSYVIFDDDSDMLYWQRNNFIHVDRYCGLTPTDVFRATKILNNKNQEYIINEM